MQMFLKHKWRILAILFTLIAVFFLFIVSDRSTPKATYQFGSEVYSQNQGVSPDLPTEHIKSTGFGKLTKSIEDQSLEKLAEDVLLNSEKNAHALHAAEYLDLFSSHWMCVYEKDFGCIEMVYIRELEDERCEVSRYEISAQAARFVR